MRGKIIFVVGLATGYVLGTRAGRERYERIKSGAEKVWNSDTVQSGVTVVTDFAGSRIDEVKARLTQKARAALAALIGREPMTSPSQSSSRPSASTAAATTTAATATKPAAAKKPAARKPTAAKKPTGTSTRSTAAKQPAADD